jgi:hypothetical protein
MRSPIHQPVDNDAPSARATSILPNLRNIGPIKRGVAGDPAFSGDRGFLELQRQLSLTPTEVPEPPMSFRGDGSGLSSTLWRFSLLASVAAMVAVGVVFGPGLMKATQSGSQQDASPGKTDAMPTAAAGGNGATAAPEAAPRTSQSDLANHLQPRVVGVVPVSDPPVAVANNPAPAAPAPMPAASTAANAAPSVVANAQPGGGASAVMAPLAAATAAAINTPAAAALPPPAIQPPPPPAVQPPPPVAMQPAPPAATQPPPVASLPAPQQQPAPAPAAQSSTPPLDSSEIAMLMKRGQYFMESGDISSAQLLFRRAAEAGSAQGAFALASTYDSHYLAAHQVIGVAGNDAKARIWYQRALDLGSPDAKGMLAQLGGR